MRLASVALATLTISASANAGALTGQVVDENSGVPVRSAEVRVYKIGLRGLAAELESDREGRFVAQGLPDGEYRIEVSKPNHVSATIRSEIAGDLRLAVRLVRCGVISGQVIDVNAQPVRGADVFALSTRGFRRTSMGERSARVGEDGRYRIHGLPPGEYAVVVTYGASTRAMGGSGMRAVAAAYGSGVLRYRQPIVIAGGEAFGNIDFTLPSGQQYSVSGRVEVGEKQTYWLALAATEDPTMATAVTIAKPDGSFEFTGVPAGSYELLASLSSGGRMSAGHIPGATASFARSRIVVGSQDVKDVVLTPAPARAITFSLQKPGGASCNESGEVMLAALEDWGAVLDTKGSVGKPIGNLAPTKYRVTLSGAGDMCHAPEDVTVDLSTSAPAGPVSIRVAPAGTIHGRLAAALGDAPVALHDLNDGSRPVQLAYVGPDSKFAFTSIPPGRYRLTTRVPNGPRISTEVAVTGGAATEVMLEAPQQ
jgi:hypothetical protein